jgi:NAD(P)-dependent dehydrogenase (short-subunit alcohol dehydrogenase family)
MAIAKDYQDRALPLGLDVTQPSQVDAVVADVIDRFGRIDVLVNNAGRGQFGAVEATSEEDLRDMFDVHFFGAARLTRAVLPVMRRQQSGAIVAMSSGFGRVPAPGLSAYSSAKAALEGFHEALAAEVEPLGITVLIVQPGAFRTEILAGAFRLSPDMSEYDGVLGPVRNLLKDLDGTQPGDPDKAAAAVLTALAAPQPPLRLPLGDDSVDGIRAYLAAQAAELDTWDKLGRETSYNPSGFAGWLSRRSASQ